LIIDVLVVVEVVTKVEDVVGVGVCNRSITAGVGGANCDYIQTKNQLIHSSLSLI
jgi:hypothetical protein